LLLLLLLLLVLLSCWGCIAHPHAQLLVVAQQLSQRGSKGVYRSAPCLLTLMLLLLPRLLLLLPRLPRLLRWLPLLPRLRQ
jgi:hypothetical protein